MKLVYKFSLLVCAIVFLVLSTITFLLIFTRTKEIQKELTEKDTATATVLLSEFGQYFTDYYFYQYDTYREIVRKKLTEYPDALYFRMYSPEAEILFDSSRLSDPIGAKPVDSTKSTDPLISKLIASHQLYTDITTYKGEQVIRVVAHYVDKYDIPRNTFEFYFSTKSIRQAIRDMIVIFVSALLFFSLLSVGVTIILVRQIIKPIEYLTQSAQQLAEGKLVADVPIETNDEIGTLASAFSRMAQDLKVSRDKLEKQNTTLEDEVKRRTNELQAQVDEMSRMQKLMINRELKMVELKKELEETKSKLTELQH